MICTKVIFENERESGKCTYVNHAFTPADFLSLNELTYMQQIHLLLTFCVCVTFGFVSKCQIKFVLFTKITDHICLAHSIECKLSFMVHSLHLWRHAYLHKTKKKKKKKNEKINQHFCQLKYTFNFRFFFLLNSCIVCRQIAAAATINCDHI